MDLTGFLVLCGFTCAIIWMIWAFFRYVQTPKEVRPNQNENSNITPPPNIAYTTKEQAAVLFDRHYKNTDTQALSRIQEAFVDPVEPYIFYVPGLKRQSSWTLSDFPSDISKALDGLCKEQAQHFRQEFIKMGSDSDLEKDWTISSFLHRGNWVPSSDKNDAAKSLRSLDCLMPGCQFGNAFLSVLKPGSDIEPHCGPTNIRIRCHLPIQLPPPDSNDVHCSITVDGETHEWKDGQWLIFDDSFLHCVRYSYGHDDQRNVRDRCLLILDLWHPDLSKEEIECIKKIFPAPPNNFW